MILGGGITVKYGKSVPRVGGGDPEIPDYLIKLAKCSPRRRG